jgi:uncharacterized protein (TIGR03382 family)
MERSNLASFTAVFVSATSAVLSANLHAAPITWSSPVNITGDSDVITTGTLVTARNLSQTQVSPTVNGVFFDIFPIPNGGTGAAGFNNIVALSYTNADSSDTAYGATVGPFTALSASYQSLLSSGAGSSSGSPLTLTLLGLSNGSSYLFQWWSNDAGLAFGGVNSTTAAAGNTVTLDENTTDTAGGMGQWVSGTFTASGTSQAITFSGPRPVINAFQVREIPTPGTAALLGLAGLVAARRRRA